MHFREYLDINELAWLSLYEGTANPLKIAPKDWLTDEANPKIAKGQYTDRVSAALQAVGPEHIDLLNQHLGDREGFLCVALHLAPATESGYNMCKCSSDACRASCLHTASDFGRLPNRITGRLRRTWALVKYGPDTVDQISAAIARKEQEAKARNRQLVVRLNGTSDEDWTRMVGNDDHTLFEKHPNVQFYDYTKFFNRVTGPKPKNYYLLYSRSERAGSERQALKLLQGGHNVSIVFGPGVTSGNQKLTFPDGRPLLPKTWNGFRVIDGDAHDLRFLERSPTGKGYVIGLKAKGAATLENFDMNKRQFVWMGRSGFMVHPFDPAITRDPANANYVSLCRMIYDKRNRNTEKYYVMKERYTHTINRLMQLVTGQEKPNPKDHNERLMSTFLQKIEDYFKQRPQRFGKQYMTPVEPDEPEENLDITGYQRRMTYPMPLDLLKRIGIAQGDVDPGLFRKQQRLVPISGLKGKDGI